eukprot:gene26901-32508_t
MMQFIKDFLFDRSEAPASLFNRDEATVTVSCGALLDLRSKIIKSTMYLSYYDESKAITKFRLPTRQRLFFVSSPHLVNQITMLESKEENPFTLRKQAYKFNQNLLAGNPVSMNALGHGNYIKHQHRLFIALSRDIRLEDVVFPHVSTQRGEDIIYKLVVPSVSQVYFPILLGVDPSRVSVVSDDIGELLHLLEIATGKHGITFQDYLAGKVTQYSDEIEQQYIPVFYRIILALKGVTLESTTTRMPTKEEMCNEIVSLLRDSNIVQVLSNTLDIARQSVLVVNNILSWIDNMLNVVHTIVNLLVLKGTSDHEFTHDFYMKNLPKARALATMFMRHVETGFTILQEDGKTEIRFRKSDILMMSNGTSETLFGGQGRKCPSKPWSLKFMEQMVLLILSKYDVHSASSTLEFDDTNDSWFWNKFSTKDITLVFKEH